LTEQGNFAHTLISKLSHLVHDRLKWTADLWASHLGNDAKRTVVVAPRLNGDPSFVSFGGLGDKVCEWIGWVTRFSDINDMTLVTRALKQLRDGS
jgi:hypothetical protein